jgi:Transposase and inactivated derivatives
MPKGYRPYLPDQDLLLPPSLREWLPEDHLVYFVSDVVDQLDLSVIHAKYGEEKRGQPPYDPRLMTKLLVYGYCTGVFSSRRIQRRIQEDIPFKVLAAGNEPDFRTISDFRKIHIATLQKLFEQVLEMALESGAVKLGRVSVDGTKVKANASKHKAMSYGRMQEKQKQLKEEVKQLLAQAEAADEEEDRRHGDKRGGELPEELRRRETRLAKIKQAKKVVEQRAREKAAVAGKSADEVKKAKPTDKDQYNFTDPESRIMKGGDGFVQGYNAQAAVEPEKGLIVGQFVTQAANDKEQLRPMLEAVEQQSGQRPEAVLADSGYCSEENLKYLESAERPERKIEGYIATGKQEHGDRRRPCKRGPLPQGATCVDRMRRKLQTKAGKAVYAARKYVVEPVFGQIKQARGFRQFVLRGIQKVKGEWALVCLTHNILRLYATQEA